MPRKARKVVGGIIYHVHNRFGPGSAVLKKPADYQIFITALEEAAAGFAVDVLAYCVMPDHWHLLLLPRHGEDLSAFIRWLSVAHTSRWRSHTNTIGYGHLYQGRFKSFPVQPEQFIKVCRFIESNPVRTKLARSAEKWEFSSLHRRLHSSPDDPKLLADWPVKSPRNYSTLVGQPLSPDDLGQILISVRRGRPLGDPAWQSMILRKLNLAHTFRPPGRPRKHPKTP